MSQPSTAAMPHSKRPAESGDVPASWLRVHAKLLVSLLVVSLAVSAATNRTPSLREFGQAVSPLWFRNQADSQTVQSTAVEQTIPHASKIVPRPSQARGHADYVRWAIIPHPLVFDPGLEQTCINYFYLLSRGGSKAFIRFPLLSERFPNRAATSR